jgi:hypothetical protein
MAQLDRNHHHGNHKRVMPRVTVAVSRPVMRANRTNQLQVLASENPARWLSKRKQADPFF